MCTRYPIINRVSELKVHIELTRFVQPEKIEIDANERAVNEKSQYCFFVCTTFDSFLNDLHSKDGSVDVVRSYYKYENGDIQREVTGSYQAEYWNYTEEGYLMFSGVWFSEELYVLT